MMKRKLRSFLPAKRPIRVPVARILRGGETLASAAQYAMITGQPLVPSTPVEKGPHAEFLREYLVEGDKLLAPGRFEKTAYYQNALLSIKYLGCYFPYAKEPHQIILVAQRFIKQFLNQEIVPELPGHTKPGEPINVRPIRHSDCFEVVDGNHRLAVAIMKGESHVEVMPQQEAVLTPMQDLLLKVLWQNGRVELYQPIGVPEVRNWPLVRRCTDRFGFMRDFLQSRQISGGSYVDLGASYGWFVAQMRGLGFDAHGVERDPIAIEVGVVAYGYKRDALICSDLVPFLRENRRKFDVVSCYSVAHHFALGRASVNAEELIGMIDRITEKVLFFDTGQNNEEWFKDSLSQWDPDFIEKWLYQNTTFKKVIRLGIDSDAVAPFEKNYSRTLFACVRE